MLLKGPVHGLAKSTEFLHSTRVEHHDILDALLQLFILFDRFILGQLLPFDRFWVLLRHHSHHGIAITVTATAFFYTLALYHRCCTCRIGISLVLRSSLLGLFFHGSILIGLWTGSFLLKRCRLVLSRLLKIERLAGCRPNNTCLKSVLLTLFFWL